MPKPMHGRYAALSASWPMRYRGSMPAARCRRAKAMLSRVARPVRSIFRGYAELGSVRLLRDALEARGIKSKSWTSAAGRLIGGKPFSRGALYLILRNRIYRGEIVHKG